MSESEIRNTCAVVIGEYDTDTSTDTATDTDTDTGRDTDGIEDPVGWYA